MKVMGILNITPDSFFDGGRFYSVKRAVARAQEMARSGVDVIDIGGESSRPGAAPVTEEEEKCRVLPVIEALRSVCDVPLSVDTRKAGVAQDAIHRGATVINDITALSGDSQMTSVVSQNDVDVVLMHMQGDPSTMQSDPRYESVVDDVLAFFERRISFAVKSGIKRERIIIDPGIGFGKRLEHNIELLRHINRFTSFGVRLLVGASRKSFMGLLLGKQAQDRMVPTLAVHMHCWLQGVDMVRVHDVAEHACARDTLKCLVA